MIRRLSNKKGTISFFSKTNKPINNLNTRRFNSNHLAKDTKSLLKRVHEDATSIINGIDPIPEGTKLVIKNNDTKSVDTKSVDAKSVDAKSVDTKSEDTKSEDTKPDTANIVDAKAAADVHKVMIDAGRFIRENQRIWLARIRLILAILTLYLVYHVQRYYQSLSKLKDETNQNKLKLDELLKEALTLFREMDDEREGISFLQTIYYIRKSDFSDNHELLEKKVVNLIRQLDSLKDRFSDIEKEVKQIEESKSWDLFDTHRELIDSLKRDISISIKKITSCTKAMRISQTLNKIRIGYKLGNQEQKQAHLKNIANIYNLIGKELEENYKLFVTQNREENVPSLISKNPVSKPEDFELSYQCRIMRRLTYQLACYLIAEELRIPDTLSTKHEIKEELLKLFKDKHSKKNIENSDQPVHSITMAIYLLYKLLEKKMKEEEKTKLSEYIKVVENSSDQPLKKVITITKKYKDLNNKENTKSFEFTDNSIEVNINYLTYLYASKSGEYEDDKLVDISEFTHAYSKFFNRLGSAAMHIQDSALFYNESNKYDIARHFFKRAIDYDGNSAAAYYNIGWSYMLQKRYDEAMPWLERASILKPNRHLILNSKVENLIRLNFFDKADQELKKLEEIKNANNPAILATKAYFEYQKGLKECFSNHNSASVNYNTCLENKKGLDALEKSLTAFKTFKFFDDVDDRAYAMKQVITADACLLLGKADTAKKLVNKFIRPETIELYRHSTLLMVYAELLKREGNYKDSIRAAFQSYLNCHKSTKNTTIAKKRLASILKEVLSRHDMPEEMIKSCIEERKNNISQYLKGDDKNPDKNNKKFTIDEEKLRSFVDPIIEECKKERETQQKERKALQKDQEELGQQKLNVS